MQRRGTRSGRSSSPPRRATPPSCGACSPRGRTRTRSRRWRGAARCAGLYAAWPSRGACSQPGSRSTRRCRASRRCGPRGAAVTPRLRPRSSWPEPSRWRRCSPSHPPSTTLGQVLGRGATRLASALWSRSLWMAASVRGRCRRGGSFCEARLLVSRGARRRAAALALVMGRAVLVVGTGGWELFSSVRTPLSRSHSRGRHSRTRSLARSAGRESGMIPATRGRRGARSC